MSKHLWVGIMAAVAVWLSGCGQANQAEKKEKARTVAHGGHDHDGHDHGDHKHGHHDHSGWWCAEHGVPEAECSLCSTKVAKVFKDRGEWCELHDRAKPQCFLCDPKLKEAYAARYRAREGKDPPPMPEESPTQGKLDAAKPATAKPEKPSGDAAKSEGK